MVQARKRTMGNTISGELSFGPLFDSALTQHKESKGPSTTITKIKPVQAVAMSGSGPLVLSISFSDGLPDLHQYLEWLRSQLATKPKLVFGWSQDLLGFEPEQREQFLRILRATLRWGFSVCVKTNSHLEAQEAERLRPMTSGLRFLIPLLGYAPAVDEWTRVSGRLEVLRRLKAQGFTAKPAWEPMIPGIHDRSEVFDKILRELAALNFRSVQVAFAHLPEDRHYGLLPGPLEKAKRMGVSESYLSGPSFPIGGQRQRLVPLEARQKTFARLHTLGSKWGIRVDVCPWNNPDFLGNPGQLTKPPATSLLQRFLELSSHQG